MRFLVFVIIFISCYPSVNGQQEINGRITSENYPLYNVHISNLSSGLKTSSDKEGMYFIFAKPKEELQFTYMGMDTVSIIIEDVTSILNIKMNQRIEQLDEVIVRKKIGISQKELELEYHSNPNIIKTSFGYLNKDTKGYPIRIISEEEIESAYNLNSIIAGRFAGVKAFCDPSTDELIVSMREIQSLSLEGTVMFDVDGVVLDKVYCGQFWGNIKRIAFISAFSGTTMYGTLGRGGIVVINTKTSIPAPNNSVGQTFDKALLQKSYIEKKEVYRKTLPAYLEEMIQSNSLEETKYIFTKYKEKYGTYPFFLLDSYVHFYEVRNDTLFANSIMDSYLQVTSENPVLLKALAYILESQGHFEKANDLYKRIYILRPDYVQSYINLASSYEDLDRHESAATLYARYAYLKDIGLMPNDSLELSDMVQRELHGITSFQDKVRYTKKKVEEIEPFNTRLVFEWNDSEAEFELQFINPNQQYFNWKHTLEEMPDRIRSEKQLGYSMVDFLMDDALPGTWKVNATYYGNKQLTPTYLKATMYKNYGSKLQTKEVKVFRLDTKGTNQNLYSFHLTSEIVHQ